MRNVNIADCENLFVKDEYRHIVFSEEDLLAVIKGEYVLKTPSVEEDDDSPNKRVTWRESLEEAFYDTEDDCVIVDIAPPTPEKSKRRFLRKQFSVDDSVPVSRPGSGDRGTHSAPSSPSKYPDNRFSTSGSSSPRTLRRSRSAERSSSSGRGLGTMVPQNRFTTSGSTLGHTHVVEEGRNKVRRVRCRHTNTNQG